jgi:hypothetical protein
MGDNVPDLFGMRWDALSKWAEAIPTGSGAWDVGVGVDALTGVAASARAGYGLWPGISAEAEAYGGRYWSGQWDAGVLAGLSGSFR